MFFDKLFIRKKGTLKFTLKKVKVDNKLVLLLINF